MTDNDAIDFLVGKFGSKKAVAAAIGVTPAVLNNWTMEERGIAYSRRGAVWALVNDHGGNLPRDWLLERSAA
jgi:hypothetical protein